MHNIIRARIHCAITLISLLSVAVLWLGVASLDPLRDHAYGGFCDSVRGL
jgi:hypothetical protein